MNKDSAEFTEAYRAIRDAQERYHRTVEATFQPGRAVFWKKGCKAVQSGTALQAHRDRVLVRNDRTGKEQWLYDFWFTHNFGGWIG